jgi:hypothetical protein
VSGENGPARDQNGKSRASRYERAIANSIEREPTDGIPSVFGRVATHPSTEDYDRLGVANPREIERTIFIDSAQQAIRNDRQ